MGGIHRRAAAVLDILGSFDPCPAVLVNSRYDVIESNDGHKGVFLDWHTMPCIHRNLLWCGITEPARAISSSTTTRKSRTLVARLRANYAGHVGHPDWEEDIRRLAELSPEFAELWARHEVAQPEVRTRIFLHPEAGRLTFSVTELEVTSAPGTRILAYTPQDDATRARLPLICAQATASGIS